MKTTSLNIVCFGALKDPAINQIENSYLKRLSVFKTSFHHLKACGDDCCKQSVELRKFFHDRKGLIVLMREHGKLLSTQDFAKWLEKGLETHKKIWFVIGGASGFSEEDEKAYPHHISLSPMTFPHALARLLLTEQVYRSETIHLGHPYSK